MTESTLDCTGMRCPRPIVKLSRAIARMAPGDELVVMADDPAFAADVAAWAQLTGNRLVGIQEGESTIARLKRVA